MSHMRQLDLLIKSDELDCFRRALATRGLELRQKDRFAWYGEFLGDSEGLAAQGVTVENYNKCAYAVGRIGTTPCNTLDVNGCTIATADGSYGEYEIGLVPVDGGYTLRFDYWGPGQVLAELCGGNDCLGLYEEFTAQVAEDQFARDGYSTRREIVDGHIDVVAYE